jgi:hypothetical protein
MAQQQQQQMQQQLLQHQQQQKQNPVNMWDETEIENQQLDNSDGIQPQQPEDWVWVDVWGGNGIGRAGERDRFGFANPHNNANVRGDENQPLLGKSNSAT